tara:strand:- start:497 stop:2080 length:1584 start_codon:yes stop_codon:yes gene_type:complete
MQVEDLIVEVKDKNLNRIGQIRPNDLVGATFVVRFNNVGSWSIKLPYGHTLGELLRLPGYGIILTNYTGETILSGPTLSAVLTQSQNNTEGDWEISGSSDDIYLTERLTYPKPSTADVTAQTDDYDDRSGQAETVIKEYVSANMGADAPVERQVAGLTIEADQGRGDLVAAAARFDNLQEFIYNLAQAGGIGYQLTQVLGQLNFSVFTPQDRSNTVRMDIANRKLSSAVLSYGTAKLTRAIVGGKGEAKNRSFIERTSSESLLAESDWGRRIETFIDARGANNTDELQTAGDESLVDNGKTITELSVTPSNDQNMVYGVDWFLGDKVTIVTNEIESTAVVTEIGISIASDGVRIGATVGTPVGIEFEAKLMAKTNQLDSRISNLERSTTGYGVNTNYQPGGGTDGTQPVFPATAISGSFNRFGNMVHFAIVVEFTNITNFGTGQYYLTLPYPSKSEYMFREGNLHDIAENRRFHISGEVDIGSAQMLLYTTDNLGSRTFDAPFTSSDPVTLTTADRFHIAGTYEIEG